MSLKSQFQVAVVNETNLLNTAVTITSGNTISSNLYCAGTSPTGIFLPDNWTAGTVGFQVAKPGGEFFTLTDLTGALFTVTANPTAFVPLAPSMFNSVLLIRLVSSAPQASDVVIDFALCPIFQGIHN